MMVLLEGEDVGWIEALQRASRPRDCQVSALQLGAAYLMS
jgi:hypothetical protein